METIIHHEIAGMVHMSISKNGSGAENVAIPAAEFEAFKADRREATFIDRRDAVGAIPLAKRGGDELEG